MEFQNPIVTQLVTGTGGQRIEINSVGSVNEIVFYTGNVNEFEPARIRVDSTQNGMEIIGPTFGAGSPFLRLRPNALPFAGWLDIRSPGTDMTMVDDNGRHVWRSFVGGPATSAPLRIAVGSTQIAFNAGGVGTLTYPEAHTAATMCVIPTVGGASGANPLVVAASAMNLATATLNLWNSATGAVVAGNVTIRWLVAGY